MNVVVELALLVSMFTYFETSPIVIVAICLVYAITKVMGFGFNLAAYNGSKKYKEYADKISK
jgi:hypothetical protein